MLTTDRKEDMNFQLEIGWRDYLNAGDLVWGMLYFSGWRTEGEGYVNDGALNIIKGDGGLYKC